MISICRFVLGSCDGARLWLMSLRQDGRDLGSRRHGRCPGEGHSGGNGVCALLIAVFGSVHLGRQA